MTHQFCVSAIRGRVVAVASAKFRPLGIAVAANKASGGAQTFYDRILKQYNKKSKISSKFKNKTKF